MAGMAINLLLRKNGKFSSTSVGRNKEMAKRGITCVKHDEIKCYGKKTDSEGCSCT